MSSFEQLISVSSGPKQKCQLFHLPKNIQILQNEHSILELEKHPEQVFGLNVLLRTRGSFYPLILRMFCYFLRLVLGHFGYLSHILGRREKSLQFVTVNSVSSSLIELQDDMQDAALALLRR